jgi:4-alpha-glucanotransferase
LIGDLAIGFDPSGADAAEFADLLATGCRIGAPPDAFNAGGQDWGLPPFVPWRLRAAIYEPLIRTFRAAFTGVHGLRIDHVMGLFRQFWLTPAECGVAGGAYVHFPHDELLAILAIEAHRANAFVVGEDLGTVQPAVWAAMTRDGMLGTTVTWFSPEEPAEYRRSSLAAITTHDLPTIAGVWSGADGDIEMLDRIVQLTNLSPRAPVDTAIVELHRALAEAPSQLVVATVDDLCAAVERPNVPGTQDHERANWCIPLPITLEELAASSRLAGIAAIFNAAQAAHTAV